jgi:DNA-directed RNA polymerase subunit RPC12/RpoP
MLIESFIISYEATEELACRECGKRVHVKQKGNLMRHIEAHHVKTAGFSCLICGKVSKTRNSLKMHKYRNHRIVASE